MTQRRRGNIDWSCRERECAYELSQQPKYQWQDRKYNHRGKPNIRLIVEELKIKFPIDIPRSYSAVFQQLIGYKRRLQIRRDLQSI